MGIREPEHEETGGHALTAGDSVLFLRGGTYHLEYVLGDSEIVSVTSSLTSNGMHNTWQNGIKRQRKYLLLCVLLVGLAQGLLQDRKLLGINHSLNSKSLGSIWLQGTRPIKVVKPKRINLI
jgi:hypothetical protein